MALFVGGAFDWFGSFAFAAAALPVCSGENVGDAGQQMSFDVPAVIVGVECGDDGAVCGGFANDDVEVTPIESVCAVAEPAQS